MTKVSLHVVDATYELFRAFFGAPPKTSPQGIEVGAVRGLLSSLMALLKKEGATHVGCATDHVIESFRNDLWPGYKTGEGLAEVLFTQFHIAEEGMRALGFVVWPMVEFEADDALATAVAKWSGAVDTVAIDTVDKDLAQCVSGTHVVMRDRRRKQVMDEAGVIAKFGVKPAQIPDYLALVGDTADGYPGIPGFGAKSAAAVLTAHGHIDDIPDAVSDWKAEVRGKERLAESLREHRRDALLFRTLATLRTDVPLTESLDDLAWRGADPSFKAFAKEHGLDELVDRVPLWR